VARTGEEFVVSLLAVLSLFLRLLFFLAESLCCAGLAVHPLWLAMSEADLGKVLAPEGPRGGGHLVSVLREALQLNSNKVALDYLRLVIMANAVPHRRGPGPSWDKCLCLGKSGSVRQVVDGAVSVALMVTDDNYPALIVHGSLAARSASGEACGVSRTLWVPCHRYMCWLCNGPSRDDRVVVHHVCEDKQCVNPAHLEWVTASENNALPNETVSRRRRDSEALQNRSPES